MLSQQLMIMEMFIITLVTWALYKRPYDPVKLEHYESENNLNANLSLKPTDEEYAAWHGKYIYNSAPFTFVFLY